MSSKAIYPEYYTKEEYEKELDKTLKLGCVEHALLFYHFCQYCALRNEDFISTEKYYDLCDFLTDNLLSIHKNLQEFVVYNDILVYTCKLEPVKQGETFTKGKHLIEGIENLIGQLDDRIDIDYKLEVVEEFDSVN
jgi:hypothetical protein